MILSIAAAATFSVTPIIRSIHSQNAKNSQDILGRGNVDLQNLENTLGRFSKMLQILWDVWLQGPFQFKISLVHHRNLYWIYYWVCLLLAQEFLVVGHAWKTSRVEWGDLTQRTSWPQLTPFNAKEQQLWAPLSRQSSTPGGWPGCLLVIIYEHRWGSGHRPTVKSWGCPFWLNAGAINASLHLHPRHFISFVHSAPIQMTYSG